MSRGIIGPHGQFIARPETAEKIRRAQAMKREGAKLREIGAALGVSESAASMLVRGLWNRRGESKKRLLERHIPATDPAKAERITAEKRRFWLGAA